MRVVGGKVDVVFIVFFFNDTATTEIYTLSLHDALPISARRPPLGCVYFTSSLLGSAANGRADDCDRRAAERDVAERPGEARLEEAPADRRKPDELEGHDDPGRHDGRLIVRDQKWQRV